MNSILDIRQWRVRHLVAIAWCIALGPWLGSIVHAQGNSATPSVQLDVPATLFVGDAADLAITIRGSRTAPAPDLSFLSDFVVQYRGPQDSSSTSTIIINNQVSTNTAVVYSHIYSIVPKRTGAITIPAIDVVVDGKVLSTQPTTVQVNAPAVAPDFPLQLSIERSSAYVNQAIKVTLVWTLAKDVRNVAIVLPVSGPAVEVFARPEEARAKAADPALVRVNVNGEQVIGTLSNNKLTIERYIVPRKDGKLAIGPVRVDFHAVVGQRQRGLMDSPWDDRSILARQVSLAAGAEVTIRELPTEGRPADFSGLVGSYSLSTSTDAKSVSVGDPFGLNINVTGPHPISLVPPLNLTTQTALNKAFRVPRDPILPESAIVQASFRTSVRARSAAVKEIPPLTLSYFDPEAGTYKVAKSQAIPLMVSGSSTVVLPDVPESPDVPVAANQPPNVAPDGLPDIDRRGLGVAGSLHGLDQLVLSKWGVALLLSGPAIALVLVIVNWQRDRLAKDPLRARRMRAFRSMQKRLRLVRGFPSHEQFEAVSRALADFVADVHGLPAGSLPNGQAVQVLDRSPIVDSASCASLRALLVTSDDVRFGRAPMPDAKSFAASVEQAAHQVQVSVRVHPSGVASQATASTRAA